MKADMFQSLNDRHDGVEEEYIFAATTLLDPSFKDNIFYSAEAKSTACQPLITKMSELSCEDVTQLLSPKKEKE